MLNTVYSKVFGLSHFEDHNTIEKYNRVATPIFLHRKMNWARQFGTVNELSLNDTYKNKLKWQLTVLQASTLLYLEQRKSYCEVRTPRFHHNRTVALSIAICGRRDATRRDATRPFIRVRAESVKVSVFRGMILCNRETRTLLHVRMTHSHY